MANCIGRRTFVKDRVHFGNGDHWVYAERQCENEIMSDSKLCQLCSSRDATTGRLQAQPGFPHGVLGEEIPLKSQIYGGEWYKFGVLKWGQPCEKDLKFLEEVKQETMKKYFSVGDISVLEKAAPVIKEKVQTRVAGIIVAIELDEDPIIAEEVAEVVLKSIRIDNKDYYYDLNNSSVYSRNINGGIDKHVGFLKDGLISKK